MRLRPGALRPDHHVFEVLLQAERSEHELRVRTRRVGHRHLSDAPRVDPRQELGETREPLQLGRGERAEVLLLLLPHRLALGNGQLRPQVREDVLVGSAGDVLVEEVVVDGHPAVLAVRQEEIGEHLVVERVGVAQRPVHVEQARVNAGVVTASGAVGEEAGEDPRRGGDGHRLARGGRSVDARPARGAGGAGGTFPDADRGTQR
mmetsp:Transcript_12103/g.52155  ORF Transcript_12103/g.52155 Transcript_12103/m.52155 type:complete len:205 (+) Transcript_12103:308-922(+)